MKSIKTFVLSSVVARAVLVSLMGLIAYGNISFGLASHVDQIVNAIEKNIVALEEQAGGLDYHIGDNVDTVDIDLESLSCLAENSALLPKQSVGTCLVKADLTLEHGAELDTVLQITVKDNESSNKVNFVVRRVVSRENLKKIGLHHPTHWNALALVFKSLRKQIEGQAQKKLGKKISLNQFADCMAIKVENKLRGTCLMSGNQGEPNSDTLFQVLVNEGDTRDFQIDRLTQEQ